MNLVRPRVLACAPLLAPLLVACGTPASPTTPTAGGTSSASATPTITNAPTVPPPQPLKTEAGWSVVARVPGEHAMHLLAGQDGVALVSIETKDKPHRWIRLDATSAELVPSFEKGMPAFTFDQPEPAQYGSPSFDSRGKSEAFLTVNRETELGATCEAFLFDGSAWKSVGTTTAAEGVCLVARVATPGVGVALVEGEKGRILKFFGKGAPTARPLAPVGDSGGDLTPVGMGAWSTGEIVVVGVGGKYQVFAQGWSAKSTKAVVFTLPLDGNSPVDTRFPSPTAVEVYSGGILPDNPNEEVAAKFVMSFDGKSFKQVSLGPGHDVIETVMIPTNWPALATNDARFGLGFVGQCNDDIYVTGTMRDGAVVESVVLRSAPVDRQLLLAE